MREFKNIQDVEDWLEPMDYDGFWYATGACDLTLQPRAHCDAQLAAGEVEPDTMLYCLKHMARMELTQRFSLKNRLPTPWLKLVGSH
jgi:hypothetical protein